MQSSNNGQRNAYANRQNGDEFRQWIGAQRVFGHLHAFREIPNSNPPAYSVRISVPQGRGDYIRYTALELVVDSLEAYHLLNKYANNINDDNVKCTLNFSCYGLSPKAYALKNGDGAYKVNEDGSLELRAFIAGKLNRIAYLKIGNDVVLSRNNADSQTTSHSNGSVNAGVLSVDQAGEKEGAAMESESPVTSTSESAQTKPQKKAVSRAKATA